MGKKITEGAYRERLKEKFGTDTLVGTFRGINVPARHVCTECNVKYRIKPFNMLYLKVVATCIRCSSKNRAAKQKVVPKKFLAALKRKFSHVTCTEYVANHSNSKFICTCGNEWETKPYELLKLKHGCPECAKRMRGNLMRLSDEQIREKLAANNPEIEFVTRVANNVGTKSDKNTRAEFKCKACGHLWQAVVSAVSNGVTGCPKCFQKRSAIICPTDKVFKLGKRKVIVQGYEHHALRYLTKKVAPEKIRVGTDGIECVPYTLNKAEHAYHPDIKVGNTIVEVKSTYTLFAAWHKNIAKAKACIASGFKFRMLVVVPVRQKYKCIVLPSEWTTWSAEYTERYIDAACVKTLRILAMDPGVTNYAWSILEVSKEFDVKVIASGALEHPIANLTNEMHIEGAKFIEGITELIDCYRPNRIIAERFMARGMKGTTIELVNIMLGAILGTVKVNQRMRVITAAQWKNEWNRVSCLENFYTRVRCSVHQADSVGIGLYGAYLWLNQKPFFNLNEIEDSIADQLSAANIEVY